MQEDVRWTNLRPKEIRSRLQAKYGTQVSKFVVRRLLQKHGYRRRKAQKKRTMQQVENRDEQFQNIARLRQEYEQAGNPVMSMDTKKKEYLGNFYRDGHLYTRDTILTNDHDFISFADGVVIPHALYDLRHNHGYIHLGTSKDTSQFACEHIRTWWQQYGLILYPHATSILILCDGGGSNSSRYFIFKQDLYNLANELGVEIRIAHYPPYCSKYNPIEHRLFPHITRACQGVVFKSVDLVKQLMENTVTRTGLTLTVSVAVVDKVYQTGRQATDAFKEHMPILFDDYLPRWNYRAVPL